MIGARLSLRDAERVVAMAGSGGTVPIKYYRELGVQLGIKPDRGGSEGDHSFFSPP